VQRPLTGLGEIKASAGSQRIAWIIGVIGLYRGQTPATETWLNSEKDALYFLSAD
jgi:hypothetical protein